ncbi:putative reverse transcriptase domain-containing protein [Tanacetum coccineum]|uniref:Reverse transcriptase domain-containing protein n=1 Tax=Tanacetum coccineum TaxID=301880 RepID=A0ABQ5CMD3_9ASTR
MRMEQYLQCIDYTLWDGNSPLKNMLWKARRLHCLLQLLKKRFRRVKVNSIKDDRLLLKAIEKRFGRNAATKKTQRNILKQQYENFTTPSSETLDQTFDKLQKIMSQLEILGETISQEDVNQKLLRNDLEEIDLRWQMAMLTMRARRFLKKTGRRITMNGNESIGFDKSKVECYNCHKKGYFAREYRAPRNQDSRNREPTRRIMPIEETTSNALVSQCAGFGLMIGSDPSRKGPTNFALWLILNKFIVLLQL